MNDTVRGNPNCEACALHRVANWVCLMGSGAVPSKVMVIGEAPGQKEDETGKPFQGPAGKLLDKMLSIAKLDRNRLYITNSVKCRPPENRTPRNPEMKACKTYLAQEFDEVRPRFVILLGATAVKQVLGPKQKITEIHGHVILRDGITYLPTFHPAMALRDPKRLGPLTMDFEKFGDVISGVKREVKNIPVRVIRDEETFSEALDQLINSRSISFDIETTGLNYKDPDGKINCLGWATDFDNWSLPLESDDSPWRDRPGDNRHWKRKEMVHGVVEATNTSPPGRKVKKRVSAQSGKFDNNWLYEKYKIRMPLNYDTMLAFHLINENDPSGLKYRAMLHCGAPDYDVPDDVKVGKRDLPRLYQYNGEDCYYTRELVPISTRMLQEQDGLWELFNQLVMPVARQYEQIEMNGVFVNVPLLRKTGGPMREEIADAEYEMQRYAGTRKRINWNSTQQVGRILFDQLGLTPLGYTEGGQPSSAEGYLLAMRKEHPIVDQLLRHRKYQKLVSGFVEGWENRLVGDYLYPKFKLNGTITGRPSCEDPNIQQTPREKLIRQLISAPDGWTFFESDYSQIELRVAAMLSGDRELCRIYAVGEDVHRSTAASLLGKPESEVTEEERKMAKAVNFGFLYGMGYKKFVSTAFEKYNLIITDHQSRRFRHGFFEKFSGLPPWHERQRRIVRNMGQVRTLTGRIRHLQEVYSPDKMMAAKAERDAINSPAQGFAAELTLMAIAELGKLPNDQIQICGTVHDAIIGRVRNDVALEMMQKVKNVMERPPLMDRLGIQLSVPIEVEVKLGPWGIGKKVSLQ